MPTTITMPKLSPTMESGTIVKWIKKEGEMVSEGDVLFEVATDKATVEHSSLDDGFLAKILIAEGSEAKVNQTVAILTASKDESIEGFEVEQPKEQVQEEPKEDAATEKVETTQPVQAGIAQPAFVPSPPLKDYEFEWPTKGAGKVKASPLAKKLAKKMGINLASVKGSGPNNRVVKKDLELAQKDLPVSFGREELPEVAPGTYEEQALSPMRKVIGERLQGSKSFIPHFYVQQTVLMDEVIKLRTQLKESGIKLTFNDFIVRACAIALREHPVVNSGFNSKDQKIIRFKTIDISIAVSIEEGLITPIVRLADFKNIGELSQEVKSLAMKAKEGKLQPHEYQGGSFTISNLGMFGIDDFQAVINPPQAAILAVGGIIEKPVVVDGQIKVGHTLTLSLSSDHRVIDGSDAAAFLKTVQKYLENPVTLVI